jgi:hypothetical protein
VSKRGAREIKSKKKEREREKERESRINDIDCISPIHGKKHQKQTNIFLRRWLKIIKTVKVTLFLRLFKSHRKIMKIYFFKF